MKNPGEKWVKGFKAYKPEEIRYYPIKLFYEISFKTTPECILPDVLFENNMFTNEYPPQWDEEVLRQVP
ncbi:MAG TPA: hypothetical protein PKI12_05675 [Bacteroidales bacterium]|nr:hypothetical protein [Bacteroidales bacterium]